MTTRSWTFPISRPRTHLTRSLVALVIALLALPVGLSRPSPATAYNVCSDPEEPCVHEYMAGQSKALWSDPQIEQYWNDIRSGVTHEDEKDHVYSNRWVDKAIVTITHFWDSDLGDDDGVSNILGTFPNAWQKASALWSLALGAYAKGDKPAAYHLLGHVAHLMGDATIPTHVHDDMHGPDWFDDDSFEEWMSVPGNAIDGPAHARVSSTELDYLKTLGIIQIPANEPRKLHWLLYTTNQIADFFASDDFDGDAIDPLGYVQSELDDMAANISSPRSTDQLDDNDGEFLGILGNNDDDGDLSTVRQWSYLRGIRAIAALYKLFEETVQQRITLAVVIDRVDEDEDHDYVCLPDPLDIGPDICAETSDPDFYGRVSIAGWEGRNRGDEVVNDENIEPHWGFGASVGVSGSVPVHVEIWDNDGAGDDIITLGGADDQSDIDGDGKENDLSLDLNVDLAKCLSRQPGAITGDLSGDCGATLASTGDADFEASRVEFRIFMSKAPPVADAGGPYTTPEGTDIQLSGNGSTDPDGDITTYAWDLDGDGACDDVANDPTPDFTAVGQDGATTVKLCVADATGLTDEDTATVIVTNVTPTVGASSDAPKGENTAVTVNGVVSDPGWLDSLTATIDWGDGLGATALSGTLENNRPNATLTYSTTHTYGDNGTFAVTVCARDDDTNPCSALSVVVTNTDPTASIDLSGAVLVNGVPAVIAKAGQAVTFNGRAIDPGSDDLLLAWEWGDGTPGDTTSSLVNPPNPDPALSPTIQPRDVASQRFHTFGEACTYETSFAVTDDDAGSSSSTANVIIVGNGHPNQPHGYWKTEVRYQLTGKGRHDFDAARLTCYLRIAGYMSRVFDEQTVASTFVQAADILDTSRTSDMTALFDQQLLAAWLNFANGAIAWDRMVDTTGDKTPDIRFLDAVAAAETMRLSPTATTAQLEQMKKIVERWTNLP